MYLLCRYLECSRLVSGWAGAVYIVFPWHLARTPHGSLVHLEVLPLLLLALVAAMRRPTGPSLALVGLATLACWLTSGYFGVMAVVAAAAFVLAAALVLPLRRGARLVAGTVGAAIAASLVVGVLSIISGFGRGAGLNRVPEDLYVYGVRPLELLLPSPGNLALGGLTDGVFANRQHGSNPTETRNYLGLVTIALALTWLAVVWRRRKFLSVELRSVTAGLAGVFVAALLFAAPSPITVLGQDIWMPSRLLWEVVPAVRVPSRWVALAATTLIPLAALGLQATSGRLTRMAWGHRAAHVFILVVAVLSFSELAIHANRPRFDTAPPPHIYEALRKLPPGIVAEYPLVTTNDNIIWQTVYRRPLLNNADFGTEADQARRVVLDPAVPGVAQTLALLGVTAIVTHPDALRYVDDAKDVPNARWGPGYELVERARDGSSLWRVTARAAPAVVMLSGGFGEPSPTADELVGYPLVSPSGVGTIEFVARAPSTVRLRFAATPPRAKQTLRLADADTELPITLHGTTEVAVLVEIPAGHSYLIVKTDPAATSEDDAVVLTKPRAVVAFGTAALTAVLISPNPGF
jgi:hypothetical protein